MAGIVDSFEKLPVWQRIVVFVVGSVLIVAGWYFLFYQDAVAARASAEANLRKAETELARLEKEEQNFLERERKQAELEAQMQAQLEKLPTSASTVDNLMQTFQQQARLVGMTVESWTPKPEEKQDFYAKLPISIRATGTWPQLGEFFRRVSELDRIVSVDKLSLKVRGRKGDAVDAVGHPILNVEFEAATYRFLSEAERSASKSSKKGRRRRRK